MNIHASLSIQDDTPGRSLRNPVEAAQNVISALEDAESTDSVFEKKQGREWSVVAVFT